MSDKAGAASGEVFPMAGDRTKARGIGRWRRLVQIAALAVMGQWSFYGIFRCPFIVPYVSCQNCPVLTCHGRLFTLFNGVWLLIPASAILFGRAFCGWACPQTVYMEFVFRPIEALLEASNLAAEEANGD